MKPILPLIITATLLIINIRDANCQSPLSTSCSNSNFSQGNFTNWSGCYGSSYSPCTTPGFDSTSTYPVHKIFSDTTAADPKTCSNVHKVCPGEAHSARLGRDGGISGPVTAGQIKYIIQVDAQPYYFIYKCAIVLENGNHMPQQQPCFIVEVQDSLGNYVASENSYYYYGFGAGLPGWQTCAIGTGIDYRDWEADTVDLSAYYGQTVTATFTSKDCPYGNHHGYAYINTYCLTPVTKHWTGAVSNLWNNPGNWNPEGLPSSIDIVIIPASATTMPVVNVTGMACHDLLLEEGATINIPAGFHLTVNGDIVMNPPK